MFLMALVVAAALLSPSPALAQHHGYGGHHSSVVVGVGFGGFYNPWGSWYPYSWAWGGPWGYPGPYWGGYYGAWGPYPYDDWHEHGAEVRVLVKPKEAQVYVDGYYRGIVDDFDGSWQRLRLEVGEHEIVLFLKGYRTVKQKLALGRGASFKLRYEMQKLAAGETAEPVPAPAPLPPKAAQEPRQGREPREAPPEAVPNESWPRRPEPPREAPAARTADYGTLVIRVQPADAEVLIDDEPWRGSEGQDRLSVAVAAGTHRVEIRKSGYKTFTASVDVRFGETTPLNVSLSKE
jgi:hypothetical protein